MRIVTAQELESWLASGRVLERDARGPKVVALSDGRFLKIFHTRRPLLQSRLWPAARRFRHNAERLRARGVATPDISEIFWLNRRKGLSACLYAPLPGESLEQLLRNDDPRLALELPALASFFRLLHCQGVYFRSLHLGNILLIAPGQFGLIDVLDLRCYPFPLNRGLIRRNFEHLRSYLQRRKLERFPLDRLLALYQASD
ncbi:MULTISPECIES: toluene tolerance protein [unclassified Pseudomonas]|uniref:toluene tolerance protein n=1 Tax=unclassified Pseudomonas TaxID=196821 RepID=UPI0024485DDA|nr:MULTISPECIES: toluene tolerance protein [unclassified Pseudomonas]MDG9925605.1 toluene tolerance protein [Pseudomonas sp. GD04045]MDH0035779.1 toluene tolerance protein [Pseudomonas sp. GD04019]